MHVDLTGMRTDYSGSHLGPERSDANPIKQFENWFQTAMQACPEPNAMTLATADASGKPTARIVLLKSFSEAGFIFYSNYESRKGLELEQNPKACLLFFWQKLHQQVRIEGTVSMVSRTESEEYFQSRPLDSQIGAWASAQSRPLSNRQELEAKVELIATQYKGEVKLPVPPHWGGYMLRPDSIEFWQGQPNRLHDRLLYSLMANGQWQRIRLAP